MNNYQQRIRERAEQFFNRFIQNAPPNLGPYDDFENSIWKDDMLNLAKLSVDAEAEAYTMGWRDGRCNPKDEMGSSVGRNNMLLFFGLIPPPENSDKQE